MSQEESGSNSEVEETIIESKTPNQPRITKSVLGESTPIRKKQKTDSKKQLKVSTAEHTTPNTVPKKTKERSLTARGKRPTIEAKKTTPITTTTPPDAKPEGNSLSSNSVGPTHKQAEEGDSDALALNFAKIDSSRLGWTTINPSKGGSNTDRSKNTLKPGNSVGNLGNDISPRPVEEITSVEKLQSELKLARSKIVELEARVVCGKYFYFN